MRIYRDGSHLGARYSLDAEDAEKCGGFNVDLDPVAIMHILYIQAEDRLVQDRLHDLYLAEFEKRKNGAPPSPGVL